MIKQDSSSRVRNLSHSFLMLLLVIVSCFVIESWSVSLQSVAESASHQNSDFSLAFIGQNDTSEAKNNTSIEDDDDEDEDDTSIEDNSSSKNNTEPIDDTDDDSSSQDDSSSNEKSNDTTPEDDEDDSEDMNSDDDDDDQNQSVDPEDDSANNSTEIRYYSHRAEEFEKQGLIHMIAFADNSNVYLWDPIANQSVATILEDLPLTTGIAVDVNKGYIFVCTYEQEDRKSLVYRYTVKVDLSQGITNPVFSLNKTEGVLMFTGKIIQGITVDGDQSILYVADQGTRRIISINYGQESMKQYGTDIGLSKNLYEEEFNLASVSAVAINHVGGMFWSCEEDGTTEGAIYRASADQPEDTSAQIESKKFSGITALAYANAKLYFIADDQTSVYAKVPHDQHSTQQNQVVLIADGFSKATDVSVNDNYIYVSDQVDGLFVIERLEDGTFTDKNKMYMDQDYEMTSMLFFTIGATRTLVQVGLLAVITSLAYMF